ncbi:multidrug resistance protein, SMR family [Aeromicrobium marinum DSM 15272]|uniref:Multidrug resistance protein, SMR family n=2 Tax=Aeromicrobium marinum TaxID=219314 RepID=E2S9B8_9ACTN|nr:multidrug resistance protein, SMR family [Aeromicrobium marinum DSM 15272]
MRTAPPDEDDPYPDSDKTGREEFVMAWIVLIVSGVLEAVWATALGRSEGFTRLAPSAVFAVALALSMAGLAWAMRDIPVGTAYAVWVGIGASLTVVWSMSTGGETVSAVKIALVLGLVGCVVGLKLVGDPH